MEDEREAGQRWIDNVSNNAKLFGLRDWRAITPYQDCCRRLLKEVKTQQVVAPRVTMMIIIVSESTDNGKVSIIQMLRTLLLLFKTYDVHCKGEVFI